MRSRCLILVLVVAAVSAGCAGDEEARVRITYEQDSTFDRYKVGSASDPGVGHAQADGVWVMYRILSIDNTGEGAGAFNFDSNSINVATGEEFSTQHAAHEIQLLGPKFLGERTIPAGEKMVATTPDSIGCFIMHVSPKSLAGKLLSLTYPRSGDQPVSMQRDSKDTTVGKILGDAEAESLQSRCAGKVF